VLGGSQTAGRKREPAQLCQSYNVCGRRVAIDSSLSADRSSNRQRRRVTDDRCDVDEDVRYDDRRIQQLATLFTSTDVRDGGFTARLPVDVMPHGDVMIRMCNGYLEVLQTEMNDQRCAVRRLCGVIELPIYVDTDSVTVRHDPQQQCLVIEATTKGCQRGALRRRSVSVDELWWPRGRKVAHDFAVRLTTPWKRREHDHTVVLCSETKAVAESSDDTSNDQ